MLDVSQIHESPFSYQISTCLQQQSSLQIIVIPPEMIAMRQPPTTYIDASLARAVVSAIGELVTQKPKRGLVLVDTNRRSN
jgi:hypothetical protein